MDPEQLFTFEEVQGKPPARARIHDSVICAECGERTMETRVRRVAGRDSAHLASRR